MSQDVGGGREVRLVPPLALALDAFGRMVATDGTGRRVVGVEPVRAFPLTEPGRWFALMDSQGREIATIEDAGELEPEARRVLLEELGRREFMPVIEVIEKIEGQSPLSVWTVVTDRGRAELRVERDDALRRLGPHRLMITDKDGLRYLIADTRLFTAKMQRKLQALV